MVAQTFNEYNLITCFSNDYNEKWLEKAISFIVKMTVLLIIVAVVQKLLMRQSMQEKNISNYLHRYEK